MIKLNHPKNLQPLIQIHTIYQVVPRPQILWSSSVINRWRLRSRKDVQSLRGKSDQLYQEFYKKFKKAHFDKSGNWVTTAAVKVWRESLDHGKDKSKYKEEMAVLDGLILKKQNVTIKGFFVKQQEKKESQEDSDSPKYV